jgi:Prophage antirepressor
MTNLMTVSGVKGYIDENGAAQLNLEDVARGLGFTQTKNGIEYVRYERVNGYLADMGFPQLVGKEFVPENVFYRLAMKGETEAAMKFQAMVADEILPTIRKTGTYSARPMSQAELIAAQANLLVEIEQKTNLALKAAEYTDRRVTGALNALAAPTDVDWQTATGDKIKRIAVENQLTFPILFGDLYKELENTAHVNLNSRVSRLKKRMEKTAATYKERQAVSKLHVISLDPALKLAFDGIVRRTDAKYAAARLPKQIA